MGICSKYLENPKGWSVPCLPQLSSHFSPFITLSFPFTFFVPFTFHFSLPPYIVPSAPEFFQLDYLLDTAVLLEWMPPKYPNGRLLRYVLEYQQGESVAALGFSEVCSTGNLERKLLTHILYLGMLLLMLLFLSQLSLSDYYHCINTVNQNCRVKGLLKVIKVQQWRMLLENLCEMTIWPVLKNPQQRKTTASQIQYFPDVLLKVAFLPFPPDVVILPPTVIQNNSTRSLSVTSRILTFPTRSLVF